MLFGKKKHEFTDAELIERFNRSGKKEWAGELFNRHAHLVLGTCLKYLGDKDEARDATMNVFLQLLEDMPSEPLHSFKSWLYVVTKNHCLMELRKKRPERINGQLMHIQEETEKQASPGDLEVQLQALEAAIDELKPTQQGCIRLFYLERKSYAEVAKLTGLSEKEVKSQLQNGRRMLRLKLSSEQ